MKKKILIVSSSFYPINSPRSFRTTELVKEFARQGHDITVYIHKNDKIHIPFEKEYGVTIKSLGKLKLPILDLTKGNKYYIFFKRIIQRTLLQLFEYPSIELMFQVKKALKNENGYDLLISIAAPHPIHWGVAWVNNVKKPIAKTWVADSGDPYMMGTLDTFNKFFYFKYLEKWWCDKADYISIPFSGATKGYYKKFHHKIKVIPQGFNFNAVEVDANDYQQNNIITFAYSGGFIPRARDPRVFIEYLLSLNINFKFIIFTQSLNMIMPYVKRAKGMVEVYDYVSREKLIKKLSKMDFVINFNNGNTTQLPSKLIDYYLTKRPVLSIDSFSFDKSIVNQFLERDYSGSYTFHKPDQYKIENVCNFFLVLTNEMEVLKNE